MPIFIPDIIKARGKNDAKRHRQKRKDIIRKKLPEIIADQEIIKRHKGKTVKIPIPTVKIPTFEPNRSKEGGIGMGQGDGDIGDIIDQRPISGEGDPNEPGSAPGEDYIETEVPIEELIEMMMEDLGLPNLDDKNVKQITVDLGYRIKGRAHSGPSVLRDRRLSAKEGFRRYYAYLNILVDETGKDQITCSNALKKSKGLVKDALELLKDESFVCESTEIEPFAIMHQDDLRYFRIDDDIRLQSQAVIFALIDVSGSMNQEKKYFVRSMLFWLVEFLRKIYEEVEIRFIIYHGEAKFVEEDAAFKTSTYGGTMARLALELMADAIETQYPISQWNVYAWQFSDGDDFEPEDVMGKIKEFLEKDINMYCYCEVKPQKKMGMFFNLLGKNLFDFLKEGLNVQDHMVNGVKMLIGQKDMPFLAVVIEEKEHIMTALEQFLKKDRWTDDN